MSKKKPRQCKYCIKNNSCKLQKEYTDKKTGILTCPDFK